MQELSAVFSMLTHSGQYQASTWFGYPTHCKDLTISQIFKSWS